MTRRAALILPSNAMPWGRWLEGTQDDTTGQIDRIKSDPNSPGNQFKVQAEKVASQINGIQVSSIREFPLPGFSHSVSGPLGTRVNSISSTYTFSSPTSVTTSCLAIVNFRITSSSGVAPMLPMIKVNGQMFSDVGANPQRPPTNSAQGYYAVMGNVLLTSGQTVSLEYGAASSATPSINTLTFDLATVWLAFYGGL